MTRLISTLFAALFVLTTINNPALAVTINGITATGQFLFVDNISINDVGVSTGEGVSNSNSEHRSLEALSVIHWEVNSLRPALPRRPWCKT